MLTRNEIVSVGSHQRDTLADLDAKAEDAKEDRISARG
jgi:hypothetical protein